MKIELINSDQLTEAQKESIRELRTAVYPTTVLSQTMIGSQTMWASPQQFVLVWDEGELAARVGLLQREVLSNGEKKNIGGVGGLMTHPEKQGMGFTHAAMNEAVRILREELMAPYALLFCGTRRVEYYKRLQWVPFMGQIFVSQPRKERMLFTISTPMVLDMNEKAPLSGVLELNGFPW
jgi:GNAT superfamily N-acetyltransferase